MTHMSMLAYSVQINANNANVDIVSAILLPAFCCGLVIVLPLHCRYVANG